MANIQVTLARDLFYALFTASSNLLQDGVMTVQSNTLTDLALKIIKHHPEEYVKELHQDTLTRMFEDETQAVVKWSLETCIKELDKQLSAYFNGPLPDRDTKINIVVPIPKKKRLTVFFKNSEPCVMEGSEPFIDAQIDKYLKEESVIGMKFSEVNDEE